MTKARFLYASGVRRAFSLACLIGLLGCGGPSDSPDGTPPPDGTAVPDGTVQPDGSAVPDGTTPPDGTARPDGSPPPDGTATATVGPAGGTIELPGGGLLEIPPGALDREVAIVVTPGAAPQSDRFRARGLFLRFEPAGLNFAQAASLSLPLPAAATPETARIAWREDGGEWFALAGFVDIEGGLLHGQVTGFSEGGPADWDENLGPCCTGTSCRMTTLEACGGVFTGPGHLCEYPGFGGICEFSTCCPDTYTIKPAHQCSALGANWMDTRECDPVCCDTPAPRNTILTRAECQDKHGGRVLDAAQCRCTSDEQCNDYAPCTADRCDRDTGLCVNAPITAPVCGDGCLITGQEECEALPDCAARGPEFKCVGCRCERDEGQCLDDDDCIDPVLRDCLVMDCLEDEGFCIGVPGPAFAPCDDGSRCTEGDSCDDAGQCVPGTLCPNLEVWPCTEMFCDTSEGEERCNLRPTGECVTSDTCPAGEACVLCACQPVQCRTTPDCVDPEPADCITFVCLDYVCEPRQGGYGTACDDQNACTQFDQCDPDGACRGSQKLCNEPPPGACFEPEGTCVAPTGECTYGFMAEGTACGASTACTQQICDFTGACVFAPIGPVTCGDGCVSRPAETCESHADCPFGMPCVACQCLGLECTAEGDCPDDTPDDCLAPVCTEGRCESAPKAPYSPCDDGDGCTTEDRCDSAGLCQPGTPLDCETPPDSEPCLGGPGECQDGQCGFPLLPVGTECGPREGCTVPACDFIGRCVAIEYCPPPQNACRVAQCVDNACVEVPRPGVGCDDDTDCASDEVCSPDSCTCIPATCESDCLTPPADEPCWVGPGECIQGRCVFPTVAPGTLCGPVRGCFADACDFFGRCVEVPYCGEPFNACQEVLCIDDECVRRPRAGAACVFNSDCAAGQTCNLETCACETPPCGTGTWLDPTTGLEWQRDTSYSMSRTYAEAMARCTGLGEGWRTPTISELRSLIRGCANTVVGGPCLVTDSCTSTEFCMYPDDDYSCDGCEFLAGPGQLGTYRDPCLLGAYLGDWSSTIPSDAVDSAYFVRFDLGGVSTDFQASRHHSRCVRQP